MTQQLVRLLARVPGVYADLIDGALPTRSGEPSDRSPDPTVKPAPGNLDVMDHRHELLRGLRWWVDAVDADSPHVFRLGDSVSRMCAYLSRWAHVMAPEDRIELADNLADWLAKAWPYLGDTDPVPNELVRVHDAAARLGVTVRTIRRRVPIERRPQGLVLLREAWRCDHCDLRWGDCPHTRAVYA